MKSFRVIIGVIASLLVSKSETKDFCEAFKDNDFQIDYGFDYWFHFNTEFVSHYYLIIGTDYWNVTQKDRSLELESNESLFSIVFSGQHSMAFNQKNNTEYLAFHLKFLNKQNRTLIDKVLDTGTGSSANLSTISRTIDTIEDMSDLFDGDFIPSITFCSGVVVNGNDVYQRQTFVSKSRTNGTFKRKYRSTQLGPTSIAQRFNWSVANNSEGLNDIIGVTGVYGNPLAISLHRAVLFSKNHSIWYCLQSTDPRADLSVDRQCFNESLLIDCTQYVSPTETTQTEVINTTKKTEWISRKAFWLFAILIGFVIVLVLCAFLVPLCFRRDVDPSKSAKSVTKRSTKRSKIDKSKETLSTN